MRNDVKELADAMEKGWKKCPKMVEYAFYQGNPFSPTACCANGHAALGLFGDASRYEDLPVIYEQKVMRADDYTQTTLVYVFDDLVFAGWTTPEIVAWLRTHQED